MGQNFIRKVSFEIWKVLNRLNNFCHPDNWIKLIADFLKTTLKVLKKHIIERNFHKKSKRTKIIQSMHYLLLSEKLKKLSKFWFTFFKRESATLVNGIKYHRKSENFISLKEEQACCCQKIFIVAKLTLFGKNFESSKNREIFTFRMDALTQISNNLSNEFHEYRSFVFYKTLNFIIFVEVMA